MEVGAGVGGRAGADSKSEISIYDDNNAVRPKKPSASVSVSNRAGVCPC